MHSCNRDVKIPKYNEQESREISVGSGIRRGSLGGVTLGVGLLIGGIIFNITGGKLSDKADEVYNQMRSAERKADKIGAYLVDLFETSKRYPDELDLDKVDSVYQTHLSELNHLVNDLHRTEWMEYSESERLLVNNTVLLIGLLYQMCSIQLILTQENEEQGQINKSAVEKEIFDRDNEFYCVNRHSFGL